MTLRIVLQAFDGPWFDGKSVVVQNLSSPVQARYVRFNPREPLSSNGLENYLCMRIDILSCQNGNNSCYQVHVR